MTAVTVRQERAIRTVLREHDDAAYPRSLPVTTVFWVAWVVAGLAVEIWALLNRRPGDTLSEQFWKWLTGVRHPIREPAWCVWAGRALILAFAVWIGPHLAFGWWT